MLVIHRRGTEIREIRQGAWVREDAVITLTEALAAGWSRGDVRRNIDAGRWQRLGRTVYRRPSEADAATLRLQYIRATVWSLGPDAVAVYSTAAELHGIAGLPPEASLHVAVPGVAAKRRVDTRVRVHQLILPDRAITTVCGTAATTPLWTAAQMICRVNRYAAVSVLDSALNKGLITPDEFELIPSLIAGRRGARAARTSALEADARAQSPLETRVRLRCVDGGVPPDVLQYPIRDVDGFVLAVADAAWPAERVAAEADGRGPHSGPDALYQDRWRQNHMTIAGWTVLRFTWADALRPDYIPETVRQALRRAKRRRSA